jgi:hypothetical protein
MADRAKIVVHPSGADSDLLPARDALAHVLDFLSLLNFAERDRGSDSKIVWLLENISSNSPVTAEMLGVGIDPSVMMGAEVAATMETFAAGIEAAIEGTHIPTWMLNSAYETAHRFFKRNTEVVGRSDIVLNGADSPIYVPASKARVALINLERAALDEEKKVRDWTHTAYGSIEGIVIATGTHYNKPAIWVRERKTKRDIRCVFDQETAKKVGARFKWETSWRHGRVVVEGLLQYGKAEDIEQVSASDVVELSVGTLDIADFADPTFTNGLTPEEYLDRWRDNGRG